MLPASPRLENEELTLRQLEVALELLSGRSNGEIAERLFITVETVKYHITDIFKTCRVRSRSEFIAKYLPSQLGDLIKIENDRLKLRVHELEAELGRVVMECRRLPKGS